MTKNRQDNPSSKLKILHDTLKECFIHIHLRKRVIILKTEKFLMQRVFMLISKYNSKSYILHQLIKG